MTVVASPAATRRIAVAVGENHLCKLEVIRTRHPREWEGGALAREALRAPTAHAELASEGIDINAGWNFDEPLTFVHLPARRTTANCGR